MEVSEEGPANLRCKIEKVATQIKWRKFEGNGGIVVEKIEAAGGLATENILALVNKTYRTGEIPEMMKETEFIVIPKSKVPLIVKNTG